MNQPTQTKLEAQQQSPPACSLVFYDGSCPLCQREIALYSRLPALDPIVWTDVSATGFTAPAGTTTKRLMERFHTLTPAGELISGARAFAHVWSQLPGWRILGSVAQLPGVMQLMEIAYRLFLPVRPWIQAAFKLRKGRAADA